MHTVFPIVAQENSLCIRFRVKYEPGFRPCLIRGNNQVKFLILAQCIENFRMATYRFMNSNFEQGFDFL